jgi:hypothetical protein
MSSLVAAITNALHRDDAVLRDAIAEIRQLQDALATIRREFDAKIDPTRFKHDPDSLLGREERALLFSVRRGYVDPNATVFRDFMKGNPEWRDVLARACRLKLAVAESESARIEQELAGEFRGDDLTDHPKVRRARHEARKWRSCCEDCATERDQARLWKMVVRNLFSRVA